MAECLTLSSENRNNIYPRSIHLLWRVCETNAPTASVAVLVMEQPSGMMDNHVTSPLFFTAPLLCRQQHFFQPVDVHRGLSTENLVWTGFESLCFSPGYLCSLYATQEAQDDSSCFLLHYPPNCPTENSLQLPSPPFPASWSCHESLLSHLCQGRK